MKTYPHQVFIAQNNIEVTSLPKLLQKRLTGFDELLEDLPHAVDEDYQELKEKIEVLSLELEEDLQEYFEENLVNNDELEETRVREKKAKPAVEIKKIEKPLEKKLKNPDEEILDKLYGMGRKENLKRSSLEAMGLKAKLGGWEIPVGKYTLKRTGFFTYTYSLLKVK